MPRHFEVDSLIQRQDVPLDFSKLSVKNDVTSSSIKDLRLNLISTQRCKYAANRIKKIIAEQSENKSQTIEEEQRRSDLLWNVFGNSADLFVKFWADYFELFDILGEKQSHIIQPVLKDKIKIFQSLMTTTLIDDQMDKELCEWFCIILWKMIHHDNRLIAKEGLIKFLELGNCQSAERQKILLGFLDKEILPFIKNHVGWILSDAGEFFQVTKTFGSFLRSVHKDTLNQDGELEMKIVIKVLSYLLQDGTCRSPSSLFFLIESLGHSVNATDLLVLKIEREERCNGTLQEVLSLLNKTVTQALTTVDLFLKREIERTLQNILVNRIFPVLEATKLYSNETGWDLTSNILSFIGGIDLTTFINGYCPGKFNWFGKQYLLQSPKLCGSYFNDEVAHGRDYTRSEFKGFFRMTWVPNRLTSEISEIDLVSKIFDWKTDVQGAAADTLIEFLDYSINNWSSEEIAKDKQSSLQLSLIETSTELRECLVESIMSNEEKDEAIITTVAFIEVIHSPLEYQNIPTMKETTNANFTSFLKATVPLLQLNQKSIQLEYLIWKVLGVMNSDFSEEMLESVLDLYLINTSIGTVDLNRVSNVYGVEFRTKFYQAKLISFAAFFKNFRSRQSGLEPTQISNFPSVDKWRQFIPCVMENVDKTGFGGVINSTNCVHSMLECLLRSSPDLFKLLTNDPIFCSQLHDYVQLSWSLAFEIRKTEAFWTAMKELTTLISNPFFSGQRILTKYATKIFEDSENVLGLPLLLIESLNECKSFHWNELMNTANSDYLSSMLNEIVEVCLTACISGVSLPKSYRVAFGLWEYLKEDTERNPNSSSDAINNSLFTKLPMMRLVALQILQIILKNLKDEQNQLHDQVLEQILNFLLSKHNEDLNKKYFANSAMHRKRQRIVQSLLILQPRLKEEQNAILLQHLLIEETLQPSVRYLNEWIISRILLRYWNLWDTFFEKSVKCWSKRIGCGTYFASICFHIALQLPQKSETEPFFEKSLKYLMQLVLGNHATVKAYAQVCYQKIFDSIYSTGIFPDLIAKHQIVNYSLTEAKKFCVGNSAKILQAIEDDFYIQIFNPETHYKAEVILIYLPHLSQVASDELPTEHCIERSKIKIEDDSLSSSANLISIQNLKELYQKYNRLAWHLKITPVDGRELGEEVPLIESEAKETPPTTPSSSSNFQKKINPWKMLSISEPLMDDMSESIVSKKSAAMKDGLIVVGSLVDRIPNLGGLCRSCEIFGVSKYVIPHMGILEDQQFQNLAVSAQNWVEIIEVPPKDLELFIATYKAKGYNILGIEQAQESIQLNHFKFPRKSLLLLGNEKFGIPSNLLHLMDTCLEIPQVGVIRSLNVHVTGALCIWQYAAQHSFPLL